MWTHNLKVGLVVLTGIVLLIVAMQFVGGEKFTPKNTYQLDVVFDNVQGLGPGAKVWLSGVEIGKVEQVVLRSDGRAVLKLLIGNEYKIRRDADFTIKVGFLKDTILSIKNPEIKPAKIAYFKDGDVVKRTTAPATLDDLVGEAHRALGQVNDMLTSVKQIVGDDTMKQNIFETVENVKLTTESAKEFAEVIKLIGESNRENVNVTIGNIRDLTDKLNDVAGNVDMLIANANDIAGDPAVKGNIKEAVASLKDALAHLEETTESVKDLITDDEVQQDLRDTIKSTKRTMDNADQALSGFSKAIKTVNETEVRPSFDFRYDNREDLYHADMNLRLYPPDAKTSYLVGLDDLGEDSRTSLMLGVRGNDPGLWYMFGIKSGKLGLGAEWETDKYYYEGELIDPNDLRLNLRIGKPILPDSYLMLGWESAFKRDGISIGVKQKY